MTDEPTLSPEPQATAKIQPVRLGLLGLNFGEGIARRIAQTLDCLQLVAVCDLDENKVQRVANELGVKSFTQLDAMLADPDIEAIALFTGPNGRAKLISKILQAGRHVLTTKPFELDVAEAEAVLAEAREKGLLIHLNSPAPKPAFDLATIHGWIAKYDLGQPVAFQAKTWSSYREQPSGTWYDDPEKCAAAPILRLGVYFLNEFASFMGEPSTVHVVQTRIFTQRPTSDHAHLTIEFESGAIGSVFASFCIEDGRPWRDQITLNFERGTINRWVERKGGADMNFDHAVLELWKKGAEPVRVETPAGDFAGWYQWEAFQSAIRGGHVLTDKNVQNIVYGVRLLEAMRLSALSGQPEPVESEEG